ncbi:MAG: carbohydrate ABC transporter permease [Eubacteriales bacterium]|nr:carbohydrate ABC transporter permease [Eubacteriales bacterium]MDD4744073.1 carbohydrate ABC transporter permease [Eubacteriales bacterium]
MDATKTSTTRLNVISSGWNLVFVILLAFVALFILVPMLLIFIVSFSSELSIANRGYSFWPEAWTLDGYKYLFKTGDQLANSYLITSFYTVTGTLMSMTVMTMFSYVIAQRNFPLCRALTWMLFFTMLFSGGLVPSYILNVRYLRINDTVWIFLLPSLVNAFYTIILRTFIQTTIPETLFEAARIDGAGHFRVFTSIVLPLFKTGIATVGLFNVVTRWNDWFIGMLYIRNPKLIPLQTMLTKIQDSIEFIKQNASIAGTPDGIALLRTLPDENLRMACTIVVILPILLAYPFFQRFFVRGLTVGSIKG